MPVYEYRCRTCGHQFDVQQSFTDDALTVCPECEGELRKVFAPVGISFKGSGFYKTDSRSGSSKSSSTTGSTGSTTSGTESGSGSSSDSSGSGGSGSSSGDSGAKPASTSSTSTSSSD
jgi:putative FmdB family regulatory protein